jgi:hypothetical protein
MEGQRRRSSRHHRRIANLANGFTCANQRAAIAADARATGIAWLVVRQKVVYVGKFIAGTWYETARGSERVDGSI